MEAQIDLDRMTKEVIKVEVIKRSFKSLLTLVPLMLGVLGIGSWAILDTGLWHLGIGVGLLVVAVLGYVWNYTQRYYVFQNDYLEELHWEVAFENEWKLEEFKEVFEEFDIEEAYDQVNLLKAKSEAFYEVLESRFEEGELTHSRYRSVADQTYKSVLYNLNEITIKLKAIEGIDIDRLHSQINSTYDEPKLKSLKERLAIYEGAHEEIRKLLDLNDKAMTELDGFTVMISNANVDRFDPEEELHKALERISGMTSQEIVAEFDDEEEGFEGLHDAMEVLADTIAEEVSVEKYLDEPSHEQVDLSQMDYESHDEPVITRRYDDDTASYRVPEPEPVSYDTSSYEETTSYDNSSSYDSYDSSDDY